MISIINGICVAHRCETQAFSCESSTLQLSHNCVNSLNSLSRPQSCSRDIEDGLREADGWQSKTSTSASGRRNQPAGSDPESNRGCLGSRDIKREMATSTATSARPAPSISSWAKV